MVNGINGLLEDRIMNLSELEDDKAKLLRTTPAAYLGSCRYKLPSDLNDPVYPIIFEKLEQYNIGYFLYIGGNDSMDTVSKLSRFGATINSEIRFIGVPKTIDDDLIMTDHTPGYGSAAKFVASMVRQMVLDAEVYNTRSVNIIEIMGRAAGWLTAASVLARKYEGDNPTMIYLPETDFDVEQMLVKLKALIDTKKNVVICVSEGIHDKEGKLICEYEQEVSTDVFGHKNLTGSGKTLENIIKARLGVKVRSVELNITQRANAVEASLTDVNEAQQCGQDGVKMALEGKTGLMVSMQRVSDAPYTIEYKGVDVNLMFNQEKMVPAEWIINQGTDIGPEFINYARPLIQGESLPPMEDGLPVLLYRKH
jgi:6-phosphofructokinase 1